MLSNDIQYKPVSIIVAMFEHAGKALIVTKSADSKVAENVVICKESGLTFSCCQLKAVRFGHQAGHKVTIKSMNQHALTVIHTFSLSECRFHDKTVSAKRSSRKLTHPCVIWLTFGLDQKSLQMTYLKLFLSLNANSRNEKRFQKCVLFFRHFLMFKRQSTGREFQCWPNRDRTDDKELKLFQTRNCWRKSTSGHVTVVFTRPDEREERKKFDYCDFVN